MRLDLIEYETVADAAPVDAGDTAPVAEAAPAAEPVAETAPAAAADPFASLGIDPEDLRGLAELAPVLRQALAAPAPAHQPEPQNTEPQFTLDPFADDFGTNLIGVLEQFANRIAGTVDQRIQPIAGHLQQETQSRNQELLRDALHDTETRLGEFRGDEQAQRQARSMFESLTREHFQQLAPRYGMSDRTSELAMERAHAQVKGWEDSIAKAAVEAHVNRNAQLAGQHGEPGVGSGSGVTVPQAGPYTPGALARKYGQQANALRTAA